MVIWLFRLQGRVRNMDLRDHLSTTGTALKHWFVAQSYDALCMAGLWLIGLLIIRVPGAPLWAFLGGALQFIPNFGVMIALIGPSIAALISGGFDRFLYVLILYAVLVVIDGLFLQPYLMRRAARVPIWASILTPLVLGLLLPSFWGVLIAAPLLAIFFTYRARARERRAALLSQPQPQLPRRDDLLPR
jgi:predicted PurR-regulated permease PerM